MPHPKDVIPNTEPAVVAASLDELLAYHGYHFVRCAYQTLLGRAADSEGLRYYSNRMRDGISKIHIIYQLQASAEAKAFACNLPGLDLAIRRHVKGQLPLIGWLFRMLYRLESDNLTQRKLRALENQFFVTSEESRGRFDRIDGALARLQQSFLNESKAGSGGGSESGVLMPRELPLDSTQPSVDDRIQRLSQGSKRVYFQLKRAAIRHARGTT